MKESGIIAKVEGEFKTLNKSRGSVSANPFIRPALEQNQKAIRNEQQAALDEILKGLKS